MRIYCRNLNLEFRNLEYTLEFQNSEHSPEASPAPRPPSRNGEGQYASTGSRGQGLRLRPSDSRPRRGLPPSRTSEPTEPPSVRASRPRKSLDGDQHVDTTKTWWDRRHKTPKPKIEPLKTTNTKHHETRKHEHARGSESTKKGDAPPDAIPPFTPRLNA